MNREKVRPLRPGDKVYPPVETMWGHDGSPAPDAVVKLWDRALMRIGRRTGLVRLSRERLAACMGPLRGRGLRCGLRTVTRALAWLEDMGVVEVRERGPKGLEIRIRGLEEWEARAGAPSLRPLPRPAQRQMELFQGSPGGRSPGVLQAPEARTAPSLHGVGDQGREGELGANPPRLPGPPGAPGQLTDWGAPPVDNPPAPGPDPGQVGADFPESVPYWPGCGKLFARIPLIRRALGALARILAFKEP